MNSIPLGNMSLDTFLADYWQQKPLLIRQGMPNFASPLTGEELAGLSCEQNIESRLIINRQKSNTWELIHGPLGNSVFTNLPNSHWTLLVQAVDHWIPQAAQILERFNFIPRWRIDDLMMSYSSNGGGVGPHFDYYDVFLVQAQGERLWEIGGSYDDQAEIKENLPVKILKDFNPTDAWTLEAGDILYLPPGIGHNGIAQTDECITCSVGYRTPSHTDILREFTDYIGEQLTESQRYQDPDLKLQVNAGEISDLTIDKLQHILDHYIHDKDSIRQWFGRYITAPKYHTDHQVENNIHSSQLKAHLESGGLIHRNESSKFAFLSKNNSYLLFVDGELFATEIQSNDLVALLCSEITFSKEKFKLTDENLALLETLFNCGALYLPEPSSN